MAKHKDGVNKSEEIRKLMQANPGIGPKEVIAKLAEKGIDVSAGLFYFVKGHLKGRRARKRHAQNVVSNVAEFRQVNRVDALSTILKVKALANEVGGMRKLKALVEAICD
jgi:hypothetical protein